MNEFVVSYSTTRFPAGTIQTRGLLRFTYAELAHAVFTTGRAPGDRIGHGDASVWEFIHRVALIPAYIRKGPNDQLLRSRLAIELDRSEKIGLSYVLGQATTGLFCTKVLNVNFLMHVDRYSDQYGLNFGATRKRADLFGRCPGGWVVAEAKGRSNSMERELEQKLFAQKRSVSEIAGAPPLLALGCVASFPPVRPELRVDAFDPTKDDLEAIAFDIELDRYTLLGLKW